MRMVYDWDPEKEEWLNENRNLSFLHVLYHIDRGDLLDVEVRAHELSIAPDGTIVPATGSSQLLLFRPRK